MHEYLCATIIVVSILALINTNSIFSAIILFGAVSLYNTIEIYDNKCKIAKYSIIISIVLNIIYFITRILLSRA